MTETTDTTPSASGRGTMFLEGVMSLVLGVTAILVSREGGVLMAKLLGLYWLLRAGLDLVRLVTDRRWWVWRLFGSLIGLAAGIVVLRLGLPGGSGSDQAVAVIGVLGVLYGIVCLIQAVLSEGWGLAVLGVVSGLLGLALIGGQYISGLPLGAIIGAFAVIGGLSTLFAAARMG